MMERAAVRNSWQGSDGAAQDALVVFSGSTNAQSYARKLIVDNSQLIAYVANSMIRSFKSKALAELWEKGRTAKIDAKMHARSFVVWIAWMPLHCPRK